MISFENPKPGYWTSEQLQLVASALFDLSIQEELHTPNHPDSWALDYVYDSSLRLEFEKALELESQQQNALEEQKHLDTVLDKATHIHTSKKI